MSTIKTIQLLDSCAPYSKGLWLAGECLGEAPKTVQWQRDNHDLTKTTVFTDMRLSEATVYRGKKIAMLIEPPSLSDTHYRQAIQMADQFDTILTHSRELLDRFDGCTDISSKYRFYPFGGSWIRPEDWCHHIEKTKMVSLIASKKDVAVGHKLRHVIAAMAGQYNIDLYGYAYKPVESKITALRDYHYSIVVEPLKADYYFSEKLIDCFSQGTIPIYWGCPSIGDFFWTGGGMLTFDTLEQLDHILTKIISPQHYLFSRATIIRNFELAQQFRVPEDWIYKYYADKFD